MHEPSRSLIPQVELLRAIALAGIFIFHLSSVAPQVIHSGSAGKLLGTAARYGLLGVVVFNFITGFVLALPHLGPQQKPPLAYRQFLRRRFLRICPKYYIALSLWTLAMLFLGRENLTGGAISYVAHLTFLHSIFPSTFFAIVPAYWWLGLLAQFYLVFPLIMAAFAKIGPARACLLTCLVCWSGWSLLDHVSRPETPWAVINYMIYYNLPARLPEFTLGMWLAAAWRRNTVMKNDTCRHSRLAPPYPAFLAAALLFALSGSTVLELKELPVRHMHLLSWCLVCMVLILFAPCSGKAGSLPVVANVAAASYSIYLLHQPLLGYANRLLGEALNPMTEFVLLLLIVGPISFALAAILDKTVP